MARVGSMASAVRRAAKSWRRSVLAAAIVIANLVVSVEFLGLSYERFDWKAYAQAYIPGEDEVPGGCSDGIDNDGDGLIDCADPDCFLAPNCRVPAPAPALSWYAMLASVLALGALAARALRGRRRTSRR